MAIPQHVPVLSDESLEYLNVRPGGTYADATLGFAGHSLLIAARLGPTGRLIAFDRDEAAMEQARTRLGELAGRAWDRRCPRSSW